MNIGAKLNTNKIYRLPTPMSGFPLEALIFIWALGFSAAAMGTGRYFKVDYPGSDQPGQLQTAVTYTIWIPDGVQTLRGIIVHQHGAGTTASKEGSTASYDLQWQALTKKWDCAMLGPSYHVLNEKVDLTPGGSEHWFDPRRGSENTFRKALAELGAQSGHAELDQIPWVLWGHSDGIYNKSKGGMTFSGCKCEHLPYLVEIDNWGVSHTPGQAGAGGIGIWGYDEISWFAHQSNEYRAKWLRYAWDWVRKTDPNGYLQMPGSRTVSSRDIRWYFANNPGPAVPNGFGDEDAIAAIWAADFAGR